MQKQIVLPSAVTKRSQMKFYEDHVTTSNFMEFSVSKCMELVPNEKIKIDCQTFTRLEPLSVPTFGRASVRTRAFFVPFRTVYPAWDAFITDSLHTFSLNQASIPSTVRQISNAVFAYTLANTDFSSVVTNGAFDFTLTRVDPDNQGQLKFTNYKFTPLGRWTYKLLRSLGYSPVMDLRCTSTDSALPLYCAFRAFFDWFYPSHYSNSSDVIAALSLLTDNSLPSRVGSDVDQASLMSLFKAMYQMSYEADYFTAAWDNPNAPNDDLASTFVIPSVNNVDDNSYNNSVLFRPNGAISENAPLLVGNGSDTSQTPVNGITQFALNSLRALTDYMQRHKISGGRVLERYLSRFHIKLPSEKLNRSVYLGEHRDFIQFSDVTSFASTDGATLGDYAGKGIGKSGGSFEFEADEYGMLLIVSTIVPETQYYQGINRHVKHRTKLEFYTPEFDALGTQAIYKSELLAPLSNTDGVDMNAYNDGVFGFTGMYGEYKVGHSLITGDYVLGSRNVGKDSWTLMRDVSGIPLNDVVHNIDFVTAADKAQYNRIFDVVTDASDKFNIVHSFALSVSFPGRSLFDTYEFKDEDKAEKVTMPVNGDTLT